ncbi:MAG: beta-propeller fold lactonase family protein [Bryobacteraceae bacterium]
MNFRILWSIALISVSSAVLSAADPTLAVVIRGDGVVNLYRARGIGLQVIKSIPVGKQPTELCHDAKSKKLYVGQGAEKGVAEIDLATMSITANMTDPEIKNPDGCTLSPDSSKLYLVDAKADTVFVFSTSTHQLITKIPVGKEPRRALFTLDGKSILVSNAHSDTLSVIDAATNKVVREVKTGKEPRDMLWSLDGKLLIVAMIVDDSIAYYHADSLTLERQVGTQRSPQRIALSPDGQRLFSLSRFENSISVADLSESGEKRYVATIPVGKNTFNMAMSTNGKTLYTSNTQLDNTISIVDVSLMKVVNTIAVGKLSGCMLYIP